MKCGFRGKEGERKETGVGNGGRWRGKGSRKGGGMGWKREEGGKEKGRKKEGDENGGGEENGGGDRIEAGWKQEEGNGEGVEMEVGWKRMLLLPE